MAVSKAPFIRFHEQFEKAENGCWIWTGRTGSSGYGQIKAFGKMVSAHRLAHELYNGPIDEGLHVLHSCDNKLCVNPAHLRAGTRSENIQEAIERGCIRRGIEHPLYGTRGRKAPNRKPVIVLGKHYESQDEAEKTLGLGSGTVRYWIINRPDKATLAVGVN